MIAYMKALPGIVLSVVHTESAEEDVLEVVVVVVVVVDVVVVVVVVVGKHSGGIGSPSSLKFHNIRRASCYDQCNLFKGKNSFPSYQTLPYFETSLYILIVAGVAGKQLNHSTFKFFKF